MKCILSALAASALMFAAPSFAQTALTDAEITKVLITVNEGEIDAAKIADGKVKNNDVKNFAKMMKEGHEKNKKLTKELAKKHDIDMKKSDLSKSLADQAKMSNKDLKKAKKDDIDMAYVNQQVMMHEKALSLLKDTLIPAASNSELKEHLSKTQADVEEHLSHARKLQTDIK